MTLFSTRRVFLEVVAVILLPNSANALVQNCQQERSETGAIGGENAQLEQLCTTDQTFHGNDIIEIEYLAGSNSEAVVAFTGVEFGLGGISINELRETARNTANHVYIVTDRTRHWFNSSVPEIVAFLNADIARRGIRKVVALGNSMGGFGAIFFAPMLNGCHRAIAFSPQSAADPSIVPWDRRFLDFTRGIKGWAGLDAAQSLKASVDYFVFAGEDDPLDVRHAKRFLNGKDSTMTIYLVQGASHNLVFLLEEQGVLKPLLRVLVDGQSPCAGLSLLMERVPHEVLQAPGQCN